MDTDQARALLNANNGKVRALRNLENAAAMASDDPRSTELLESAGDSYAEAMVELYRLDADAVEHGERLAAKKAEAAEPTGEDSDCRLCGTAKNDGDEKCPSCGKLDRPPADPPA